MEGSELILKDDVVIAQLIDVYHVKHIQCDQQKMSGDSFRILAREHVTLHESPLATQVVSQITCRSSDWISTYRKLRRKFF